MSDTASSSMTTSLDALPTECLALVLSHLQLRDTAACVCATKRFLQASALPTAWEQRLARVYDLRLQVMHVSHLMASRESQHRTSLLSGTTAVPWGIVVRMSAVICMDLQPCHHCCTLRRHAACSLGAMTADVDKAKS